MLASGSKAQIDQIRGNLDIARANARTVAAITENPGCSRRRVIEAARVQIWQLSKMLGHSVDRGQSPFAISTGNHFETRLKQASHYELLRQALDPLTGCYDKPFKICNLSYANNVKLGEPMLRARIIKTQDVLSKILRGEEDAPTLLDHPVFSLDFGGAEVFLEPDGLVVHADGSVELVEIKSFAIVDDQGDPDKLAATSAQAGVYLIALKTTIEELGLPQDKVKSSYLLVTPKNFGRVPIAYRLPLRKKENALLRVLRSTPRVDDTIAQLPSDFTLDLNPSQELSPSEHRKKLADALNIIPMRYEPACIQRCDLFEHCRGQTVETASPAILGRASYEMIGAMGTMVDAIAVAQGTQDVPSSLIDVQTGLQNAWDAIERARKAFNEKEEL